MFVETLFGLSFLGIAGMLSFKLVEERMGGVNWWTNFIVRADSKIHQLISQSAVKYKLWKKVVLVFIFEFLPAYAYEQTIKLKDYIYKRYHSSAGKMKGERRMLRTNGSVSEFLQNIKKIDQKAGEDIKESDLKE